MNELQRSNLPLSLSLLLHACEYLKKEQYINEINIRRCLQRLLHSRIRLDSTLTTRLSSRVHVSFQEIYVQTLDIPVVQLTGEKNPSNIDSMINSRRRRRYSILDFD